MAIKLEKGEGIIWITVESDVVSKWYKTAKGANNAGKVYLENAAQNFLLNHLHLLRSERIKSFWVEDTLMDTEKQEQTRKYRADVIVEYADEIWLIEVKGQNTKLIWVFQSRQPTPLCGSKSVRRWTAVWQVNFYKRRIKKLGWWGAHGDEEESKRKIQKVVFWCHKLTDRDIKRLPIDLSETSKWPIDR